MFPFSITGGSSEEPSSFLSKKLTVKDSKVIPIFVSIPVPPETVSKKLISYINTIADKYGVPRLLVYKLIIKESGWLQKARNYNYDSVTGKLLSIDIGVMQLNSNYVDWMIKTFGDKNIIYDVRSNAYHNVEIGIKYLAWLYKRMQSWRLAVMAYNCGPTNVQNGNIPVRTLQYANYIVPVENWWEGPENVVLFYEE